MLSAKPMHQREKEIAMLKHVITACAAMLALSGGAMASPASTTASPPPAVSTSAPIHANAAAPSTRTHAAQTAANGADAATCRTHRRVGGSCECAKSGARHGLVEAGHGHNMCVVPAHPHA
jgi:hypothetical protein